MLLAVRCSADLNKQLFLNIRYILKGFFFFFREEILQMFLSLAFKIDFNSAIYFKEFY